MTVDMTRPVPCMERAKQQHRLSLMQQYKVIADELDKEVYRALAGYLQGRVDKLDNLAEELTDVITACTTMLAMLGYGEQAREQIQVKVNEKNRDRGYWVE